MKKIILLLVLSFFFFAANPSFAQTPSPNLPTETSIHELPKQEFFKATVEEIVEQGERNIGGFKNLYQVIRVRIEDGTKTGKFTVIQNGTNVQITKDQLVKKGDELIVSKATQGDKVTYSIYDYYRLNIILIFLLIFFAAVILVAGLRGIGSILGMIISLGIILFYIVPHILKGNDPLTITLIGSSVILLTTTYLAHGISKKTSIALVSTFIALFLTAAFSIIAIKFNSITGLGNEDFYTLQMGPTSIISIRGLFLSAIIISTLGALNDITTTQAATIMELKKANPKLKFLELFEKGLSVGREHIASLVNTLVLAYVGSAFAVFIFLVLNPAQIPYWVIINNEIVSGEVIKIISGSMGLLLSVPIVTFIASYIFSRKS